MASFYPHSTAAAYIAEADRDTGACQELNDQFGGGGGHPAALVALKQRCYDSKVGALDRALLKMCSFDWVVQDQTSTVIHVRVGDAFCGRPPSVKQLAAYLRIHHVPGKPCHLIYSAHEACGALTQAYFTGLITAQWRLNASRPGLTRMSTAAGPMIEDGDGWHDTDRQLCAMANARVLILGHGGLSYLASRVRAMRNLTTLPDLVPKEERQSWLEAGDESAGHILALVAQDKRDVGHRAELEAKLSRPLADPLARRHVPHGAAALHGQAEAVAPAPRHFSPSIGGGGGGAWGAGGGRGRVAAAGPGTAGFTRPAIWKHWAAHQGNGDRERSVMAEREAASSGF
jgi:hypothetical protein